MGSNGTPVDIITHVRDMDISVYNSKGYFLPQCVQRLQVFGFP